MKVCFKILALYFAINALAACNTVEGFGEDLGKLGQKISDKAD